MSASVRNQVLLSMNILYLNISTVKNCQETDDMYLDWATDWQEEIT